MAVSAAALVAGCATRRAIGGQQVAKWLGRPPARHQPAHHCSAPQVLLLIMVAALAGKATVEGWDTLPQFDPRRGKRALGERGRAPAPAV